MKKLNWALAAMGLATSTLGFAVGLEYEGPVVRYNFGSVDGEQPESRGASWLIYRSSDKSTFGLGRKIQKADAQGGVLEVTVQTAQNQVETHKIKYFMKTAATEAAQKLNASVARGSGMSLDISGCVQETVVATHAEGSEGCMREHYSLLVNCSEAAFTPTPQVFVNQALMRDESELEGGIAGSRLVCPSKRVILQFRE